LNRIKTYDATGVAPNGRLYAGDLNLLQDTVAALTDYTQALAAASIAIGDSGQTISKFGTNELVVANMFRVLGVFRAASGLVSGSYTNAARNALVLPVYGLVILNSETNQYEWNSGTAAAPVWTSLGGGGLTVGLDSAKGAASATNKNKLYFSTDINGGTLYGSTGSAWQKLAPGLTETPTIPTGTITSAMILDATIVGGDMAVDAVTAREIAAGAVGASELAAGLGIAGQLTGVASSNGAYAAVVADRGKLIQMTNGGAVTLPSDATSAFAIGDTINVVWWAGTQPSLAAGAGATVNATPGLKIASQYGLATAIKVAANTWLVIGNLVP
jgi:hypothetical protein